MNEFAEEAPKPVRVRTPGVRARVLTCLRVARVSRLVESGLVALAVFAFVPAMALWSSGIEATWRVWVLSTICACLSASAWIVARRTEESEIASMIDEELGAGGEWRTAWEIESGRLAATALSDELLRRAPEGVTRQDLRDVVPPAALPLLALPFLAAGAYAVLLDHVRTERRSEFEWAGVARGLEAGDIQGLLAASGSASENDAVSPLTSEMFREAVRAGSDLERELGRSESDPEAVREALERSEQALDRFEEVAERDGSLSAEAESALAERRTLLDAARLQLEERDSRLAEEARKEQNGASPSPREPSPGTIPGLPGEETGAGAGTSSPSSSGLPAGEVSPGSPEGSPHPAPQRGRQSIPPVLPGRSFEARYDGVVTRFVQSMTRSAD